MSPWLPIDSAPKDGTMVLLYAPAAGVFMAPSIAPDLSGLSRAERFSLYKHSGAWTNAGFNPTHWMPLPTSPKEGE